MLGEGRWAQGGGRSWAEDPDPAESMGPPELAEAAGLLGRSVEGEVWRGFQGLRLMGKADLSSQEISAEERHAGPDGGWEDRTEVAAGMETGVQVRRKTSGHWPWCERVCGWGRELGW